MLYVLKALGIFKFRITMFNLLLQKYRIYALRKQNFLTFIIWTTCIKELALNSHLRQLTIAISVNATKKSGAKNRGEMFIQDTGTFFHRTAYRWRGSLAGGRDRENSPRQKDTAVWTVQLPSWGLMKKLSVHMECLVSFLPWEKPHVCTLTHTRGCLAVPSSGFSPYFLVIITAPLWE